MYYRVGARVAGNLPPRRAAAQTAVSLHLVIEVRLSDNPDHHLSTVDNDDDDKNNDDDFPYNFL